MTGRPGLAICVPGPGMTNCISGLLNAQSNCWPMILVGGSSNLDQSEMGGF
jgi:2-hydroxyacyl-CoA lyase 1